jgi:hypothetical protein
MSLFRLGFYCLLLVTASAWPLADSVAQPPAVPYDDHRFEPGTADPSNIFAGMFPVTITADTGPIPFVGLQRHHFAGGGYIDVKLRNYPVKQFRFAGKWLEPVSSGN